MLDEEASLYGQSTVIYERPHLAVDQKPLGKQGAFMDVRAAGMALPSKDEVMVFVSLTAGRAAP